MLSLEYSYSRGNGISNSLVRKPIFKASYGKIIKSSYPVYMFQFKSRNVFLYYKKGWEKKLYRAGIKSEHNFNEPGVIQIKI